MSTEVAFTKMQGLGNDFVVLDATRHDPGLSADKVRRLGHRRLGVGFDQLLVARRPDDPKAVARMLIFNADGSRAEQCGNGLRCFARFLVDEGQASGERMLIETDGGPVVARLRPGGGVELRLAAPGLEAEDVPILAAREGPGYVLTVSAEALRVGAVSMGNPHVVLVVDDTERAPVEALAPQIQAHPQLPASANVGFMQVLNCEHVRLRVYERGVGETLACGSGACAAVVVGRVQARLDERVRVDLPGGSLDVRWEGDGCPVWLTGPAEKVYEGMVEV